MKEKMKLLLLENFKKHYGKYLKNIILGIYLVNVWEDFNKLMGRIQPQAPDLLEYEYKLLEQDYHSFQPIPRQSYIIRFFLKIIIKVKKLI